MLVSCDACNIKMQIRQQFSTYWKDSNTPNIKKQTRWTHRLCDQLRWISLILPRKPVCCYFSSVCMLLYDKNKSGSGVNQLRYRMFTKKNLRGDCLPLNLGASVLHVRRALIFFHQYLLNIFSEFFSFIYQKCKIYYWKKFPYALYIKQVFFLWHKSRNAFVLI